MVSGDLLSGFEPVHPLDGLGGSSLTHRDFGLLGLSVVEEWDNPGDQGCIVEFGPGGGFLELLGPAAATPRRRAEFESDVMNDKIELQVHVDSVDDWASDLQGVMEIEGPVTRSWGNRYLWIRDPDGIRVALFQGPKE